MDNIIKHAINESWRDYQEVTIGEEENEHWAHEYGWRDGVEWILAELNIKGCISDEIVKHYMNESCVS